MKPHDLKDNSEARNSRQAHLGRFRPLSPSQKENSGTKHFIPPHGGYGDLLSFQKARIVFDGTVRFCQRLLKKSDRTCDQMIQAARSGKQNILEGSEASGTSKETEIKLTGVACASLGELLEDYRDFLRLRGAAEWLTEHRNTKRLRQLNRQPNANYENFKKEEWGKLLGEVPTAGAILDRFLHHAQTIAITGRSYRLKDHAAIAGKEDKNKKDQIQVQRTFDRRTGELNGSLSASARFTLLPTDYGHRSIFAANRPHWRIVPV
jgi:four helix bundle protein